MERLKKISLKTGVVIFIFSLLLTLTFTIALFWLHSNMDSEEGRGDGVYTLSKAEYAEILENEGTLRVDAGKLLEEKEYQTKYWRQVGSLLLPISVVFLIVLFSLSLCLWVVLRNIQSKENLKIAYELNDAFHDNISLNDPTLCATYEVLKQKFDDRLEDYKRLNSYLSHEQKNAIAILRTTLELSENKEYLKSLDYISDSIDDILTLSENTKMSPLVVVDVSLICAEVCDNYRHITDKIIFHFKEEDDTEIMARRRYIYRAVANLLDNAIKYGENKPIVVSVISKKGSVIISVQDHGIGISAEKQDEIFKNRFRINELNKDGYGIGLSLVAHVCDLCGGFVMLDSQEDIGTTFYLSFPQKERL